MMMSKSAIQYWLNTNRVSVAQLMSWSETKDFPNPYTQYVWESLRHHCESSET